MIKLSQEGTIVTKRRCAASLCNLSAYDVGMFRMVQEVILSFFMHILIFSSYQICLRVSSFSYLRLGLELDLELGLGLNRLALILIFSCLLHICIICEGRYSRIDRVNVFWR